MVGNKNHVMRINIRIVLIMFILVGVELFDMHVNGIS